MSRFLVLLDSSRYVPSLMNTFNSSDDIGLCTTFSVDYGYEGNLIPTLDKGFESMGEKHKGHILLLQQFAENDATFEEIVDSLNIRTVVVFWGTRSSEFAHTRQSGDIELWGRVAEKWTARVKPIFIEYNEFFQDTQFILRRVLLEFSVEPPEGFSAKELLAITRHRNESKESSCPLNELSVETIIVDSLRWRFWSKLRLPERDERLIPEVDPLAPTGGWQYRVSSAYMSSKMRKNVLDALDSGQISSVSPWVSKLSCQLKDFFNCPVAQPCANGYSALFLAIKCLRISNGDEVIIPSFTMAAVVNAVLANGARPRYVDCAKSDYNPSWEEIVPLVTSKTKAVIVCHLYGVPCKDLERIARECASLSITLVEDICESMGITTMLDGIERRLGTIGDMACGSLFASKIVHGGDGGFVLSKMARHSKLLASLVNHGFTENYHFFHYEQGVNAKMAGLCASLACGCLEDVEVILKHRQRLASVYRRGLSKLPVKLPPLYGVRDTPWVFGVELADIHVKRALRRFLALKGVETREYFLPLHLQPAYASFREERLYSAEHLFAAGLYLPTHSCLGDEDVSSIVSSIEDFFCQIES